MNKATIDKQTQSPLYYQVYKYFETKISEGTLKSGDALPSENEIAEYFNICRMTARRAISELRAADLVYTEHGKGTFVSNSGKKAVVYDINSSFNQKIKMGRKARTQFLEAKTVTVRENLAKSTGISNNTKCLFFRNLIVDESEPIAYETWYTVYKKKNPIIELKLKDAESTNLSLTAGVDYLKSKKVLTVSSSLETDSQVLGVQTGAPVLVLNRTIYNNSSEVIAWSRSVYRGDKCRFVSND